MKKLALLALTAFSIGQSLASPITDEENDTQLKKLKTVTYSEGEKTFVITPETGDVNVLYSSKTGNIIWSQDLKTGMTTSLLYGGLTLSSPLSSEMEYRLFKPKPKSSDLEILKLDCRF